MKQYFAVLQMLAILALAGLDVDSTGILDEKLSIKIRSETLESGIFRIHANTAKRLVIIHICLCHTKPKPLSNIVDGIGLYVVIRWLLI
jgi:hypothetical protein